MGANVQSNYGFILETKTTDISMLLLVPGVERTKYIGFKMKRVIGWIRIWD